MQASLRRRLAGLMLGPILGLPLAFGGCSHGLRFGEPSPASDPDINVYPANYKADILAAMHAYLNDPTGVRDAGIADPALKTVADTLRYVVCVRFNAKKGDNTAGKGAYAGVKEIAAVFVAGRFDRFVEAAHDQCAGVSYAPFPELQKLSR
jgi:hypothetical protein